MGFNSAFNHTLRPYKTLKKLYNILALLALLYGSGNWTITARDERRITAAELERMKETTG
jgi:hypothetical protein